MTIEDEPTFIDRDVIMIQIEKAVHSLREDVMQLRVQLERIEKMLGSIKTSIMRNGS